MRSIILALMAAALLAAAVAGAEGLPANPRPGDEITFGRYEQDNNPDNGPEPIRWQVLRAEPDRVLVLACQGLDVRPWHDRWTGVTWETCSLRAWLNGEFFTAAFTPAERFSVQETALPNDRQGAWFSASGGAETPDRVFLLSWAEAEQYLPGSGARICLPTAYALAQGAAAAGDVSACWWWLRSPGFQHNFAIAVRPDGSTFYDLAAEEGVCVRPAMWIATAGNSE